jgi:hypothetical protein
LAGPGGLITSAWSLNTRHERVGSASGWEVDGTAPRRDELSGRYDMRDFAPLQMEITIMDGGLAQLTGFPILGNPI